MIFLTATFSFAAALFSAMCLMLLVRRDGGTATIRRRIGNRTDSFTDALNEQYRNFLNYDGTYQAKKG